MRLIFFIWLQISENDSFQTTSADTVQLFTDWKMGPSSSSLNDISCDDFHEVLHIEEETDIEIAADHSVIDVEGDFDAEPVPANRILSATSDESISNILDRV